MTRNAEAALLAAAAVLAAFGVALVNLAGTGGLDVEVALTLVTFTAALGGMHLAMRRWAPFANPYLLPLAAMLAALGFSEIYRLDPGLARLQQWWLLVGAAVAAGALYLLRDVGVAVLRRYRYLMLLAALTLLLLPILPDSFPLQGRTVNGSRLWVRLDVAGREIGFQPGELAKVLLVGFLASYLAERHESLRVMTRRLGPVHIPEPRQLVPVLAAWATSFVVLVYQRDLGSSLLLFALFVTMLYVATARHAYLAVGGLLALAGGAMAWLTFGHVQDRVYAWLQPFDDFADRGYQVAQGLFAFGSGGLTGSGLGVGRPDLIPFAATDYIFAAVAEETGFAGAAAVLAGFALLVAAGLGIALRARDPFRKLLAAGLALVLGIQTIVILAGVLRLLPVTGVTLPFMSYGGSSLVANLLILALLARVSHEERA